MEIFQDQPHPLEFVEFFPDADHFLGEPAMGEGDDKPSSRLEHPGHFGKNFKSIPSRKRVLGEEVRESGFTPGLEARSGAGQEFGQVITAPAPFPFFLLLAP